MINKFVIAAFCLFTFASCSSSPMATQEVVSLSRIPGSKSHAKKSEMAWNQFNVELENPPRSSASQLFQKVIEPANRDNYFVKFSEESFQANEDKYFTESSTYMFLGVDEKTRYNRPTCALFYIVGNDSIPISLIDHNSLALYGFKQKRDLTIVKDDRVDAIAAFQTNEFGLELQFVVRSIAGPGNRSVWIWFADDLNR